MGKKKEKIMNISIAIEISVTFSFYYGFEELYRVPGRSLSSVHHWIHIHDSLKLKNERSKMTVNCDYITKLTISNQKK